MPEKAAQCFVGAVLTLAGSSAVGQEMAVYWGLDAAWYSGMIAEFDATTWQHTVRYHDGEMEKIRLSGELVIPPLPAAVIRSIPLSELYRRANSSALKLARHSS